MKFDWKQIAQLAATITAGATNHPEIVAAEQATEQAVAASTSHAPVDVQVDAYAALAVQVIETAEGFKGRELVDDVEVQALVKGVHDALHALAIGLAAKHGALPMALSPIA